MCTCTCAGINTSVSGYNGQNGEVKRILGIPPHEGMHMFHLLCPPIIYRIK